MVGKNHSGGRRGNVRWFIVLVLVLSWGAVFMLRNFRLLNNPLVAVMALPLLLALAFSLAGGRRKIARVGWKIPSLKNILPAVFIPIGQVALVVLVAGILDLVSLNPPHILFRRPTPSLGLNLALALPALLIPFLLLSPVAILQGWLNHLGEEFAWRGYLLKEASLCKKSVPAGVLVSGAVWWAWHLPFFFLSPVLGALPFRQKVLMVALSPFGLLGTAVLYSWIYIRSGSIWAPTLMHLTWNLFRNLLTGSLADGKPGLFAGDLWIVNGEGVIGIVITGLTGLVLALLWLSRLPK